MSFIEHCRKQLGLELKLKTKNALEATFGEDAYVTWDFVSASEDSV